MKFKIFDKINNKYLENVYLGANGCIYQQVDYDLDTLSIECIGEIDNKRHIIELE